jgi:hypothetical protein
MDLRRLTLPADKANHVIWGLVVALFFAWLAARAGYPQHAGRVGAAAALTAGVIKECADAWNNRQARRRSEREPHTVDPRDVAATAAGGLGLWATSVALGV